MKTPRSIMSKRTFGLFTILSLLSIGIFTVALVATTSHSTLSKSNVHKNSDTTKIDQSRVVANTSTPAQGESSTTDDYSQNQSSVINDSALPASSTPLEIQPSAQPTQPAKPEQPASTSSQQQNIAQPSSAGSSDAYIVTIVKDTIKRVVALVEA